MLEKRIYNKNKFPLIFVFFCECQNALIFGDLYLENYRRQNGVIADFFVCLDMLNITAKFRRIPKRFVKDLAISVNSILKNNY